MPYPSKSDVLFDQTSVANTALDTGNALLSEVLAPYDAVVVELLPSGAAGASTLLLFDADLSLASAVRAFATPATAAVKTATWGRGEGAAAVGEFVGGHPGPLPRSGRVGIGALGVGITARLRIIGRREFRGAVVRPVSLDGATSAPLDAP